MAKGVKIKKNVYRMIFLERPQQRAAIDEQQARCGGENHNAGGEKKIINNRIGRQKRHFSSNLSEWHLFSVCLRVCLCGMPSL